MNSTLTVTMRVALGLSLVACAAPVWADLQDPCAGFSWDVSRERAVFATQPARLAGGKDAASAPALLADRLYTIQLFPQSSVSFVVPPSKKIPVEAGFAGLASMRVPLSGIYRVSGDSSFWIDVIVAGKIVDTKDYQGQKGCSTPHKIVEFELPASVPVLLEVSSAVEPEIRVSVTAAAPKT